MSLFNMNGRSDNFNIDDAFSESTEDKIRLYSNSSETAPLTETIYEEQEPPDFGSSSLALSPAHSPDTPYADFRPGTEAPSIKTKSILKNPTLQALKDKEDNKDVSLVTKFVLNCIDLRKYFSLRPRTRRPSYKTSLAITQDQSPSNSGGNIRKSRRIGRQCQQHWFSFC